MTFRKGKAPAAVVTAEAAPGIMPAAAAPVSTRRETANTAGSEQTLLKRDFRDLERFPSKSLCSSLKTISLVGNRIRTFPKESVVTTLINLEELHLDYNLLREIPTYISEFRRLRVLSVAHNKLTSLPSTICHCPQLEILDISSNRFMALPEHVAYSESLKTIDVSHNTKVEEIPPVYGALSKQLRDETKKGSSDETVIVRRGFGLDGLHNLKNASLASCAAKGEWLKILETLRAENPHLMPTSQSRDTVSPHTSYSSTSSAGTTGAVNGAVSAPGHRRSESNTFGLSPTDSCTSVSDLGDSWSMSNILELIHKLEYEVQQQTRSRQNLEHTIDEMKNTYEKEMAELREEVQRLKTGKNV